MTGLFLELWFLMLLAFLVGAIVTYLVVRLALSHVDDVESEFAGKGSH